MIKSDITNKWSDFFGNLSENSKSDKLRKKSEFFTNLSEFFTNLSENCAPHTPYLNYS